VGEALRFIGKHEAQPGDRGALLALRSWLLATQDDAEAESAAGEAREHLPLVEDPVRARSIRLLLGDETLETGDPLKHPELRLVAHVLQA
jgi:hypothetical protein